MKTLEELKKTWEGNQSTLSGTKGYDHATFEKVLKSRVKKNANKAMQYFWASFVLQIVVYALLAHVIVRYWSDTEMILPGVAGILLYIPFTIILMRKFKSMAGIKLWDNTEDAMNQYVMKHHRLLLRFYRFKKRYELVLIPVSALIGVFLTFRMYVPGGVSEHPVGAIITLGITLVSCAMAIHNENKKNFRQPLENLQGILNDFKVES
jgi:hypothetical protein